MDWIIYEIRRCFTVDRVFASPVRHTKVSSTRADGHPCTDNKFQWRASEDDGSEVRESGQTIGSNGAMARLFLLNKRRISSERLMVLMVDCGHAHSKKINPI